MSRVTLKSQATAHAAIVEALSIELARLRLLNAVLENRLAEHEAVVAAPATTSRVKTVVRAAYVKPEWQVERAAQMAQAKARAMESGRTVRA